jgi:hypothetical protein
MGILVKLSTDRQKKELNDHCHITLFINISKSSDRYIIRSLLFPEVFHK